jgi:hypothetical protein
MDLSAEMGRKINEFLKDSKAIHEKTSETGDPA